MEIKEKIRNYITDNMILFEDDIVFKDEDNIFEMGFVNSLFSMKLLNYIETEYQITIENEDIDINNLSSVVNIEALIKRKLSSN